MTNFKLAKKSNLSLERAQKQIKTVSLTIKRFKKLNKTIIGREKGEG